MKMTVAEGRRPSASDFTFDEETQHSSRAGSSQILLALMDDVELTCTFGGRLLFGVADRRAWGLNPEP